MGYKDSIYGNYLKNHTNNLYGAQSIKSIRSNFTSWNYYYKKILPVDKGSIFLDIGCGTGAFVYFLHDLGYVNVEGVDISQQQIDEGIRLGITGLICSDARQFLKNSHKKYDCIIARDVLEHLTKDEIFELLPLVKASLKESGVFIMQSPNGEGISYSGLYYGDFTHEVVFTRSSLNQIFLNTGFAQASYYPTGPVPHGVFSTIRWILWQLLVLKARFYKVIETGNARGIFTQNIIAKAVRQ